jgi:hypothetical protein
VKLDSLNVHNLLSCLTLSRISHRHSRLCTSTPSITRLLTRSTLCQFPDTLLHYQANSSASSHPATIALLLPNPFHLSTAIHTLSSASSVTPPVLSEDAAYFLVDLQLSQMNVNNTYSLFPPLLISSREESRFRSWSLAHAEFLRSALVFLVRVGVRDVGLGALRVVEYQRR